VVAGGRCQAVAPGGGDRRQRPAGVQAAAGAGGVRLRWLTGWITDPSPWIDIAFFVALIGAVAFMIWAVFG
jgi:hypothetical protein